VVGLAGAAIVFWFLAKVLVKPDENLDPADYVMVGTLGKLTVGIRDKGTGEIVYVQGGTRKSAAARSEDGSPIEKGTEVVITQFEKGIAYVRRWDELAGEPRAEQARGAEQ
jgi:membrane protein implicated in regulation of membrane protease activity